jgi:hypothetical protein
MPGGRGPVNTAASCTPAREVAHRGHLLGHVNKLLRIAGRIMSIADVAPPCLAEPPLPGKCFV